jgi:hypothetical protein
MIKSFDEALSMITRWRDEGSRLRVAYSRPAVALWFPNASASDVFGSVVTFKFESGELTIDLRGCSEIEYAKLREIPSGFERLMLPKPTEDVLQFKTGDGSKFLVFAPITSPKTLS